MATVMHLDGDCFFASCELLLRRELVGKPVVVGEERGIATAMNYEAKALGVERGEPVHMIREKFGNKVTVLPCHFDLYHHIQRAALNILHRFTPKIGSGGIDECFIEFSHVPADKREARAHEIQKVLYESLGLYYSCGVARTKALAKLASKKNKPKGVCVIAPEEEGDFLAATPIGGVWGIGWRLTPKLEKLGMKTAKDFRDAHLGIYAGFDNVYLRTLQAELRGEQRYDLKEVRAYQKSVETTRAFGFSCRDRAYSISEFSKNIEIVCDRLVQLGVVGSHAYFFVRTGANRERVYGETPLPLYTDDAILVATTVMPLFEKLLRSIDVCKGTGISITNCIPKEGRTVTLFDLDTTVFRKYQGPELQPAMKAIRDRFGAQSLQLLGSMAAVKKRGVAREARRSRDGYIYDLPLPFLGEVG